AQLRVFVVLTKAFDPGRDQGTVFDIGGGQPGDRTRRRDAQTELRRVREALQLRAREIDLERLERPSERLRVLPVCDDHLESRGLAMKPIRVMRRPCASFIECRELQDGVSA